MSKVLSREQLNDDLWALKFRTTEVEMARDIADEIEASHEALRERVEKLEVHHRLHHFHSQTFARLPHEYPLPVRPDWDDVTDTAVAEKHRDEAKHV